MHARVEGFIRNAKDTGLGRWPSSSFAINTAWITTAALAIDLLCWMRLLLLDGPLAKAEPATLRHRLLAEPAFGTHDGQLIDYARAAAIRADKGPKEFEIQFLYGIRRDLQRELVKGGYRVRVYIPYGSAWYPYLTRRMAERPANLLFFLRALAGR